MQVEIRTAVIHPRNSVEQHANVARVYSCKPVAYSLESERELTKATLEAYVDFYEDAGIGWVEVRECISKVNTMNFDELTKLQEDWNIELGGYDTQEVINTATEF